MTALARFAKSIGMTDEAWQAMLNSGKAPGQPAWVKSFQINRKAKGGPKQQDDIELENARTSGGC